MSSIAAGRSISGTFTRCVSISAICDLRSADLYSAGLLPVIAVDRIAGVGDKCPYQQHLQIKKAHKTGQQFSKGYSISCSNRLAETAGEASGVQDGL